MKRLVVTLGLAALFINCKEMPKQVTVAEPVFTKHADGYLIRATGDTLVKLELEIADDDYERQTGLMYRSSMDADQGMLFVFPDEQYRSFYMKNTRMPLDLIFLDANYTIVDFQENASPMNEDGLPSAVPAQFVLELNGNQAQKLELDIGDKLAVELIE